jgi:DNA ligase-1
MKPLLAEDAILDQVIFPCYVQPKIDGVRALNLNGTLTGRSLDPFKGFGITEYFSKPEFLGFDGEMILGDLSNSTERLCSLTTGAMGRFKGVTEMPDLFWYLFDYITPETVSLPYRRRLDILIAHLERLGHPRIRLIFTIAVRDEHELKREIAANADAGFEGTIIRNPQAIYKEGRATKKNQELWRVKPWLDSEFLITGITEGESNQNEAKTNTLGRTERSSAKAGKVPNGQVGSLQGVLLSDVICPISRKKLFERGLPITVSPGEMTIEEATHYFQNQQELIGHIGKFKHMGFGTKDLPRFPTFISKRMAEDMST